MKMRKKKVVVLTGAGISAESGLSTFRVMNGLWEGYRVEDVASPEAWKNNPDLVNKFYNMRRADCIKAKPNEAHKALVTLEDVADVQIITQNVDDLHERVGSSNVLHLHGEIMKVRSTKDSKLIYAWNQVDLTSKDTCDLGAVLRPHIVWFGEPVPNMTLAIDYVRKADVFLVIGTSLQVYPAASLLDYISPTCQLYIIDPNADQWTNRYGVNAISGLASVEVPKWVKNFTK